MMPLPFFLGALFGKAAAGAVAKGLVGKVSGAGAKAAAGHHGKQSLARKVFGRIAEKALDSTLDHVASEDEKKKKGAEAKSK
jgi:hypothetical protein